MNASLSPLQGIKTLALLSSDNKNCDLLGADARNLALMLRALQLAHEEFGRAQTPLDYYLVRAVANVGMTCPGAQMRDPEVVAFLVAAMPRLLFLLQAAVPRPDPRQKAHQLLPAEYEVPLSCPFPFCTRLAHPPSLSCALADPAERAHNGQPLLLLDPHAACRVPHARLRAAPPRPLQLALSPHPAERRRHLPPDGMHPPTPRYRLPLSVPIAHRRVCDPTR
jgi:hypothetical protein